MLLQSLPGGDCNLIKYESEFDVTTIDFVPILASSTSLQRLIDRRTREPAYQNNNKYLVWELVQLSVQNCSVVLFYSTIAYNNDYSKKVETDDANDTITPYLFNIGRHTMPTSQSANIG